MNSKHCCYFALLALFVATTGCRPAAAVSHYRVTRIEPTKDGMLAAIVTHGDAGWFFKLAGSAPAVAAQSDAFDAFLKSVRFDGDEVHFTPGEDWRARGRSEMRYETFELPSGSGKPLELSVTTLPKPPGDETLFFLSNVNRWRGQISLPPLSADELPANSQQVELSEGTATVVRLEGKLKASPSMSPPFAGARDGQ